MKIIFTLFTSFFILHFAFSQAPQSSSSHYQKKKVSTTSVQLLYSHYAQGGKHSAVTGGKGTEELTANMPEMIIAHTIDSTHTIHVNLGVDVISSASTDKIDFDVSSASSKDARTHFSVGYGRKMKQSGWEWGSTLSFSIESDYFSRGADIWLSHQNPAQTRKWSLGLQGYFDDLRWGRLNPNHFLQAKKLIYPEELRNKEWFDEYKRNSLRWSMSLYQVINTKMTLGIFPNLVYQKGLLATPFHRVYFVESEQAKVENLPQERVKIPLGIQFNYFLGSQWILRTYYRYYWDNFGIRAHTINLEVPFKINHLFSVYPILRYYHQTQADYFRPYKEHLEKSLFYTSDYDLSGFYSYKLGAGVRFAPFKKLGKKEKYFKETTLRYAYYSRSDGLDAHIFSVLFDFEIHREKLKRQKK
ncbi:DUF3570 domain-containing protein [Rapidithrix thailandica]|uniref:DUF3570 domain-containing protein n=1 Tax=Rapidithrix thailandica TaxID=413964 RepID=A0AAW9S6U3_9BACT